LGGFEDVAAHLAHAEFARVVGRSSLELKGVLMLILIVLLLVLFGGGFWGYQSYGPPGGLGIGGIVLLILVFYLLLGHGIR